MSRWTCCLLPLLFAAAALAQQKPVALIGTLVTPDQIISDGTVLMEGGRISAVGAHVTLPPETFVVYTDGIIAPGLFGLGVAFPEYAEDPYGFGQYRVGLKKFMDYLDSVLPLWLLYRT